MLPVPPKFWSLELVRAVVRIHGAVTRRPDKEIGREMVVRQLELSRAVSHGGEVGQAVPAVVGAVIVGLQHGQEEQVAL